MLKFINQFKSLLLKGFYKQLIIEIGKQAPYYEEVLQINKLANDSGILFEGLTIDHKRQASSDDQNLAGKYKLLILNGNPNHVDNLHELLQNIKKQIDRTSRVCLVLYNPYFYFIYKLAVTLGLRKKSSQLNFLTKVNLDNFCKLAGFQQVKHRHLVYCPINIPIITKLINILFSLIPLVRNFSFISVAYLRPIIPDTTMPALSIIVPARNEFGNIEQIVTRVGKINIPKLELIFIEGHSKDQTWEEILRVTASSKNFPIQAIQQSGIGKAGAVREGISISSHDLIVILDADLTMPPEFLPGYYQAYVNGHGDFINGNRLFYPMENRAMRFVNLLGNIFFAKALSIVLESPLGDTLCGTKLFSKSDYARFDLWRKNFGEFDPFGDFNLLFPAAYLNLGIVDLPIPYKERRYGQTNIQRFAHGLMLLKMLYFGAVRMRIGLWSKN